MRKVLSACFALGLFLGSCAHVTPVVQDCSNEAAGNLINDVNTVIATGDWRQGLADMVLKFGGCVVEKAVAEVAKMAGVRGQYDDLEAMKAIRARTWLEERAKPLSELEWPGKDYRLMQAPKPAAGLTEI